MLQFSSIIIVSNVHLLNCLCSVISCLRSAIYMKPLNMVYDFKIFFSKHFAECSRWHHWVDISILKQTFDGLSYSSLLCAGIVQFKFYCMFFFGIFRNVHCKQLSSCTCLSEVKTFTWYPTCWLQKTVHNGVQQSRSSDAKICLQLSVVLLVCISSSIILNQCPPVVRATWFYIHLPL